MKWSVFSSKASWEFGEDVKKRLRLLSEVVLRTVKRRLASSFAIFFAVQKCSYGIAFISFRLSRIFDKKNGGERGIRTLGTFRYTAFPMRRLRPLNHLSAEVMLIRYHLFYDFSNGV